jgi:hypothetical protein
MPWEVRYLAEERLVDSTYEGDVLPRELRGAIESTIRLGIENGSERYLADVSGMNDGHSIVDLSEAINRFEALGLTRSLREALVVPAAAASDEKARFYETACRNRGGNVRIFADRAAALAWLAEP